MRIEEFAPLASRLACLPAVEEGEALDDGDDQRFAPIVGFFQGLLQPQQGGLVAHLQAAVQA